MDISSIVMAFGILLLLVACWFGFYYLTNLPLKDADATAKITGNCGDTMELSLRFAEETVQQARHLTDGCSVSNQCIEAVAMLSRGKTAVELGEINMMHIMNITGQLPESHLHCAQLAETTLQHAVKDYLQKLGPQSCHR